MLLLARRVIWSPLASDWLRCETCNLRRTLNALYSSIRDFDLAVHSSTVRSIPRETLRESDERAQKLHFIGCSRTEMTSTANVDFSLFGGAEILPPSLENASNNSSDDETSSVSESEPSKKYKLAGEEWAPRKVTQDPNDWLWQMTEEPHRSRRKAILKAHPEVSLRSIDRIIRQDDWRRCEVDLAGLELRETVQENGDGRKHLFLGNCRQRLETTAGRVYKSSWSTDVIHVDRLRN